MNFGLKKVYFRAFVKNPRSKAKLKSERGKLRPWTLGKRSRRPLGLFSAKRRIIRSIMKPYIVINAVIIEMWKKLMKNSNGFEVEKLRIELKSQMSTLSLRPSSV